MKRLTVQAAAMTRRFLLGVATLVALSWPAVAVAQGGGTTILSIGDGDTIRVRQAGKALTVRLACIDAPETAQGSYGQQSRAYLQQRLPIGREVTLAIKATDRYGRTVAEVISEINISLALVEAAGLCLPPIPGRLRCQRISRSRRTVQSLSPWRMAGSRGHHPPLGFPPQAPVPLQGDRLLCQSPGAAGSGAHLSRWQWRLGSV